MKYIDKISSVLCKLCPASVLNPHSPTPTAESHTPSVTSTAPRRVTRATNTVNKENVDKENVEPKSCIRSTTRCTGMYYLEL